ncbi:MAG: hypothetical protein GFH27_549311n127 [Chloroflexi bacterium AL-W]|nr:hypothetical protein [Chloroflexi bacterium AL-N1]NOK68695.1 hypothetical protein [Chloroflexi bacterium AL-N10]NOK76181.1 hypothetical protein [Chloroflexi bacterium AL-N5]NOK84182.1 hypothetical protein [Chloroflexi bacterium AL-W]NOK91319.1 hypothetical protein [Chloroflexi bacterium AL-N15]
MPQQGELRFVVHGTDPTAVGWSNDPRASAIADAPIGEPIAVSLDVPGEARVVQATLQIPEVQLWVPETPNLYVLETALQSDQGSDTTMYQFGVRMIHTEDHTLLLNDQPLFLAGVARHEEWPDSGRTVREISRIRDDQMVMLRVLFGGPHSIGTQRLPRINPWGFIRWIAPQPSPWQICCGRPMSHGR